MVEIGCIFRYVVDEIRRGIRAPLDLADLPNGLVDYYVRYWGRWRTHNLDNNKWDTFYLPLLTTLAAVQASIDAETLCSWSDIVTDVKTVRRLLAETWRAYIGMQIVGSQSHFRLNHASLRNFLSWTC